MIKIKVERNCKSIAFSWNISITERNDGLIFMKEKNLFQHENFNENDWLKYDFFHTQEFSWFFQQKGGDLMAY